MSLWWVTTSYTGNNQQKDCLAMKHIVMKACPFKEMIMACWLTTSQDPDRVMYGSL